MYVVITSLIVTVAKDIKASEVVTDANPELSVEVKVTNVVEGDVEIISSELV